MIGILIVTGVFLLISSLIISIIFIGGKLLSEEDASEQDTLEERRYILGR